MKKIGLAVIWCGGLGQHTTNTQQVEYLRRALHDFTVRVYYFNKQGKQRLLRDAKKGIVDVLLKNAFGRGHEVDVERWLQRHRIPFLGSGVQATYVGTSKLLSKQIFRRYGLPVAKDLMITPAAWMKHSGVIIQRIVHEIGFPCMLKDVAGTDSRGLEKISDARACIRFLRNMAKKKRTVIAEKFISNAYEVNCFVAGGSKPRAYIPVGMQSRSGIFSAEDKDKMRFKPDVPAKLSKQLLKKIQNVALRAHRSLGCHIFSRADILSQSDELYLIEVDVHPGFREKSPTTLSVQHAGDNLNALFLKLYHYVRAHPIR